MTFLLVYEQINHCIVPSL